MHKELVQADVLVKTDADGRKHYETVECEVNKVNSGDEMTFTSGQAHRYNVGLTLEAQGKLRDAYKTQHGLKVSTAKGKEITKGESIDIDIE